MKGHYTRPHDQEAEALALDLQQSAARSIREALNSGIRGAEDIPQEAIIQILASQMIAPTKSANTAIAAGTRLAEISGLSGKRQDTSKTEALLRATLDEIHGKRKPTNPRLVG